MEVEKEVEKEKEKEKEGGGSGRLSHPPLASSHLPAVTPSNSTPSDDHRPLPIDKWAY